MKKLIIVAIMAAFTMAPASMVGQEIQAVPEMDAPTTVEIVASDMDATIKDAPEKDKVRKNAPAKEAKQDCDMFHSQATLDALTRGLTVVDGWLCWADNGQEVEPDADGYMPYEEFYILNDPEMDRDMIWLYYDANVGRELHDKYCGCAHKKEHGKKVKREKHEPITWWCGRCGAGYGDSIPKGECPTCKDIPVITCECGFQYYAIDIDGNPSVCPECEMREWEAEQDIKVVDQEIEKPTEVVVDEVVAPEEEPEMDEYDKAIANGDYCEAREHHGNNGKHSTGTGCKYEEMHPEECKSEE